LNLILKFLFIQLVEVCYYYYCYYNWWRCDTGVLDLFAGVRASRPPEDDTQQTFLYLLYYVVPVLCVSVVVAAMFVLLRNWTRSPVYKTFTWQ